MSISSILSKVWDDIRFAVTHPSTIKKAVASIAGSIVTDAGFILLFGQFLPAPILAAVVSVKAFAVGVVTFLSPANQSKAAILSRGAKPHLVT